MFNIFSKKEPEIKVDIDLDHLAAADNQKMAFLEKHGELEPFEYQKIRTVVNEASSLQDLVALFQMLSRKEVNQQGGVCSESLDRLQWLLKYLSRAGTDNVLDADKVEAYLHGKPLLDDTTLQRFPSTNYGPFPAEDQDAHGLTPKVELLLIGFLAGEAVRNDKYNVDNVDIEL